MVKIGDTLVVVEQDLTATQKGFGYTAAKKIRVKKQSGVALAIGAAVYHATGQVYVNGTAASNTLVGYVTEAAASGDADVEIHFFQVGAAA